MLFLIISIIGAIVTMLSIFADLADWRPPEHRHYDPAGYSRHQLRRITAQVRRKDRRRARYGTQA